MTIPFVTLSTQNNLKPKRPFCLVFILPLKLQILKQYLQFPQKVHKHSEHELRNIIMLDFFLLLCYNVLRFKNHILLNHADL